MSQEGFLAFAGVAASFFRVSRSAARRGDGAALGAQELRRRRIFYYVRGDGVIADTPLWVYCLCARPPCAASSERRVLERCDIEQLRAVSLCPYSASKWLALQLALMPTWASFLLQTRAFAAFELAVIMEDR